MSRKAKWIKRIILTVVAIALIAAIGTSLRPDPVQVETGRVSRGAIVVCVDGVGRTRMKDKQTISAPVAGTLTRIALKPGDAVEAGQIVANILPNASQPLDLRSRAEVVARLQAANAGVAEMRRNVERIESAAKLASKEMARTRALVESQALPARSLDLAEAEEQARHAELAVARLTVERVRHEAKAISAALREPTSSGEPLGVKLASPTNGVVLRVHADSAGPVMQGAPLLDIGGSVNIEIVVELPTQLAIRVAPSATVRIDGAGNRAELTGRVRRVEPGAFTKVTALGVEEQRVNVIVDPVGDLPAWRALGDGFAVDAHIAIREVDGVLKAPSSAVFRNAGGYAVFVVSSGRAVLTQAEIGERSADEVEIRGGLSEGAVVVVHPSDKVENGAAIVPEGTASAVTMSRR